MKTEEKNIRVVSPHAPTNCDGKCLLIEGENQISDGCVVYDLIDALKGAERILDKLISEKPSLLGHMIGCNTVGNTMVGVRMSLKKMEVVR